MRHKWTYLFVCFLLAHSAAFALEVKVYPTDFVYTYEIEPTRNLTSALIHNIAIMNNSSDPLNLETVEIKAAFKGKQVQSMMITGMDLDEAAKKAFGLSAQGLFKAYDFHFQTSKYLPENAKFAESTSMPPETVTIVTARAMMIQGQADEVVITARGQSAGKPVEASKTLALKNPPSQDYSFPVSGIWYVGAAPSLQSHHRWVANQEFALDLVQTGSDGQTFQGKGSKLSDYFAFGKDVVAIADGQVVESKSDATESDSNLRQPDEKIDDYEKRTMMLQMEMLKKGYREPAGNYVVIKHANGEFSHYIHLKSGSVSLKTGDTVKRGQVIGQLGHSGNSTEPHLHFQVTDGADPMYSRGIPVHFNNISVVGLGYEDRMIQTGWLIQTK